MRSRATVSRGRGGFTLIEMLVVIAIIAILASLVATAAIKMAESGKRAQAEMDISTLYKALNEYKFKYDYYPANNDKPDIKFEINNNNRLLTVLHAIHLFSFDQSRLDSSGRFLDPWGNPYIWREKNNPKTDPLHAELGMSFITNDAGHGIFIFSTGDFDNTTTDYSAAKKDEQAQRWAYMKGGK